jgi:CBS domain-containing protein
MAVEIPDQLKELAAQVKDGCARMETVRTLLSWFGFERRTYYKVRQVRKALNKLKLKTEPDFNEGWIDGSVTFISKTKAAAPADSPSTEGMEATDSTEAAQPAAPIAVPAKATEDPTSRIGRLAAANRPPLCVVPDASVAEAITLMLQHDYSQLPVMTSEREVKGMFSWKSLGSRLALGKECGKVRDFMEPAAEISADASLFEAIQQIVEHECVLVRDSTKRVSGIITTADLGLQFAQLGEPFLLSGQIETHLRSLIADKYTKDELAAARDPADSGREIEDVADLTLGEYVMLLENPKHWAKLAIRVDRKTFIEELKRVVRIRNDVMHFDPDGIGPEDLERLRKFARFLSELQKKLN